MTKYAIAVVLVLSLMGAGVIWLTRTIIKAERAEVLETAVEVVKERDKLATTLRTATEEDICRALGGSTVDGVCQ